MRIVLQPGIILHQRAYRETSLLLDVFTQEYGKISLVARGVRRVKSSLRPLLQPFVPLLLSWQGKSELMSLITAETHSKAYLLSGKKLLSGFYLNELLVRLLQKQDPHPELYAIYQQTLLELEQAEFEVAGEKILRCFEKKLLEELGYGLQLTYDVTTKQPFNENEQYIFYPEEGFKLVDTGCQIVSEREACWNASGMTSSFFSGKTLLDLQREKFADSESLRQAKRLMRLALLPLIGNKPLQSRRLFLHES